MTTHSNPYRPLPSWRLWLPLLAQTAIVLAVPAQAIYTQLTGRTVILQTVPVDPYDLLRGYSVTLNYDISRTERLKSLPGWDTLPRVSPQDKTFDYLKNNTQFYVVLEAPMDPGRQIPKPWKPVRVSRDRPTALPANQVALKGTAMYGTVQYGVETYYIPEAQRDQINADISQAQGRFLNRPRPQPTDAQQGAVVEVKVDAQGQSIPLSLWLRMQPNSDREIKHYQF